ncbi:MAG: FAD-dependent oxidoreductase [Candidatus Saganbacteria bacterium]|nr:FAD-dependent oxidoreductase [Candidatus Saganbacteria bacterium]
MKDLVIIGGGPAAIAASIYAARKKLDFTVIARDIGGQTIWAGEVGNYPGFQLMPGADLAQKFREHLAQFKFDLREGAEAAKVERAGQNFKVTTGKGETIEARTVILATGKRPRLLNVPGEGKFNNKGLTYCATCEGPLFSGKDVAVVGGGNSALDAAMQLMRYCTKVYLINNTERLNGDPVMIEKVQASPVVEVLNQAKVISFTGDNFLKAVQVELSGEKKDIPVSGVFIEVGLVPNSKCVDFVEKNELGEIKVNCAAETSVPGLFAAGDVTDGPEKQIIIAAGDGAKALLTAFKYLSTHK